MEKKTTHPNDYLIKYLDERFNAVEKRLIKMEDNQNHLGNKLQNIEMWKENLNGKIFVIFALIGVLITFIINKFSK